MDIKPYLDAILDAFDVSTLFTGVSVTKTPAKTPAPAGKQTPPAKKATTPPKKTTAPPKKKSTAPPKKK